jgi:hypothetical protein
MRPLQTFPPHQDVESVVGPEAKLASGHLEDTGVAGPKHANAGPAEEPEFLQAMDVIDGADNPSDFRRLAHFQATQGDQFVHTPTSCALEAMLRCSSTSTLRFSLSIV